MKLSRCLAVVCSGIVGLVAPGTVATAYAHDDTIRITITGGIDGNPQFTAVRENDKDPVEEQVAGMMSATAADGASAHPATVPANAPTAPPKEHRSPWRRARDTAAVTAVAIAAVAVAVLLLRRSLGS